MNCILCHYAEIGLKGKNRRYFEQRLVFNIKNALPEARVELLHGRILVFCDDKRAEEVLKKVPGIANFSFVERSSSDMEKIEEKVVSLMSGMEFDSFRMTVVRSDKSFPFSSQEAGARLGAAVLKSKSVQVNLDDPQVNCHVEITPRETYIYTQKIEGEGGLPVGTGGKCVSLLSGGIDSPVSSFKMARRGMKSCFVHFHAYPVTSSASIEKVRRIVETLSEIQGKSTLYLVPFAEIQSKILLSVKENMRVIVYRRIMMRIAQSIAHKEKAKALVTGESLGQVASQTAENLVCTDASVSLPVFRPLIGDDKKDITDNAKRIGTYDISILPEEDCCVRFLPRHPETKACLEAVTKEEEELSIEEIVESAVCACTIETIII